MAPQGRLHDRVAVITGASRGLGRAIALAFAREGASLALCARGQPELEVLATTLRSSGASVLTMVADLRSTRDIERVVALTLERFRRVDILVNNASELGPTPLPYLIDYPPAAFEDVLRVNVIGPFRLAQAVLGDMLQRGAGVILNVTSDVAVHGYPRWGAYAVSKSALEGLSQTWAAELAGTGVRIHAVDPGDMDTAMHRSALPEDDPQSLARPENVAEAFVYLAGESASGVKETRVEARNFFTEGARA
jgi:NAD(P)-dependent dehydrogenase (short-subunit alcohol dehydrogenase family)